MEELLAALPPTAYIALVATSAVLVALLAHVLIYRGVQRVARRAPAILIFDGALLRHTRTPARAFLPLLALYAALPLLEGALEPRTHATLVRALQLVLAGAVAWVLIGMTRVLDDVVAKRFDIEAEDNLRARRIRTQVGLLRRILVLAIVLLAVGAALTRIPGLRILGTGLLASAGVIGIIISIGAQRPLANLVAGVQLALTQPVRVGDAVVIEDEWGTVEEITLTYVVIRVWDQRRLVLPIAHLFEKPFQNWTRTSAQVVGTVFLHLDFAAPVSAIRSEFTRIVEASPLWDRRTAALQVSDASDRTMEVRAIMSASNAGRVWDLRCEVREKLLDYIQREHPEALPRVRIHPALAGDATAAGMDPPRVT